MIYFFTSKGGLHPTRLQVLPSGRVGIPGSLWLPEEPQRGIYIATDWKEARALWRAGANAIYYTGSLSGFGSIDFR
jgi:hypothetical protein